MWSKNIIYFQFTSKRFYLFINNYLTPFKVTPPINTRALWYRKQLLFRFFFYLLNRSKTLSIGMIALWFQCHRHTAMIRHQLWTFWANLDNTLMPAFFPFLETLLKRAFWYCQQLLLRFVFYLLNHSKTLSIQCHRHTAMIRHQLRPF